MSDTVKITNHGELKYAKNGLKMAQKIGLFTNAVTPGDSHTLAGLTQPSFSGYALRDLNAWPDPTTDAGGKAATTHPEVEWEYTSLTPSVEIRGSFLLDPADNQILAVTLYGTPVTLSGNGSHAITQTLRTSSAT